MEGKLTPEEVRHIREALGLTQIEAGIVLGGGPRAFAKYEAGSVEPSAGLVRLLRLLEVDPSALASLSGAPRRPPSRGAPVPVAVDKHDITQLPEWALPDVVRSLLYAEADDNGLPLDGIHVASDYFVADGGEDGHIRWEGDPERTQFLPGRYVQLQLKTGKITPAKAAKEVVSKSGSVKPEVRAALEAGAHYVLLCTTSMTGAKIRRVEVAVRNALSGAGLSVDERRIHVWDADQLASWASRYPPVAVRLREQTQPSLLRPFRSWVHWAGRSEHLLCPWIADDRLTHVKKRVVDATAPGKSLRVVGPSGVGKSRLVLQAFEPAAEDDQLYRLVLYADGVETGERDIYAAVRDLADMCVRAIIIVDGCPAETHDKLAGIVLAPGSRLALISIDNDEGRSAGMHDPAVVWIGVAGEPVTEGIIDRQLPGLPSEDRGRLLLFSKGYPGIAIRVAEAWATNKPVSHSSKAHFVDAFVRGRSDPEPRETVRAAMLIAAFGAVYHTPDRSQLVRLAKYGRLRHEGLHAALERLTDRGVVQTRGRLRILQPRPVAMSLTARQWGEWTEEQWEAVLADDSDSYLSASAARQLVWLNNTEIARRVVATVCRPGGPFDGEGLHRPGSARVLSELAAIEPRVVVRQIERSLHEIPDLHSVRGDTRRSLVEALARIAFRPETFEDGANLLLRLAIAECEEMISNNATGHFTELFQAYLGATAADSLQRIRLLRQTAGEGGLEGRRVLISALSSGLKTRYFNRIVGPEVQGALPALKSWEPANKAELVDYITQCVDLLAELGTAEDDSGAAARAALGEALRSLVAAGFIDAVEAAIGRVGQQPGQWNNAIRSLGRFLQFEAQHFDPEVVERVRTLIGALEPKSLKERIRYLVTEMSWDYPDGEELGYVEQMDRQVSAARAIGVEAAAEPESLLEAIPGLCRGSQRWAHVFGESVARTLGSPNRWLEAVTMAIKETSESERNFDLLSGFLTGMAERFPEAVAAFKKDAATVGELAPCLPSVCLRVGLGPSDMDLAVESLRDGILEPWPLRAWGMGDALSEVPADAVARLIDALLDHSAEGFAVAVELMGMYGYARSERLEAIRPQILKLAENVGRWRLQRGDAMIGHYFEEVLDWLLTKGRRDNGARALALTLSKELVSAPHDASSVNLISPLLDRLLRDFPEVAWPLIGGALIAPNSDNWRLQHALEGSRSPRDDAELSPLLSLPNETLMGWCEAHPEAAPAYVMRAIPFLVPSGLKQVGHGINPTLREVLDRFGDREGVLDAAHRNIHSFGWVGSLTTYFQRYKAPVEELLEHPKPEVARWARRMLLQLDREIEEAQAQDDEDGGHRET